MEYYFETDRAHAGRIEAANEQQARVKIETQYSGERITLVESMQSATGAPANPAASRDPHNWAKAFELAAARG